MFLYLVIVVGVVLLVAFLTSRPKTEQAPLRLEPEETVVRLAMPAAEAFPRCERALAETGAEIRTADPERLLFTAAYALGGRHDRLAVILRLADADDGCEVEIDYKTASFTRDHEERALARLRELRARIAG